MDRISDVNTPEPEWKGLSDVDVTRLKSASEQLVELSTRSDQTAVRDQAMLLVMLDTALRVSELISLDIDQPARAASYDHDLVLQSEIHARLLPSKAPLENEAQQRHHTRIRPVARGVWSARLRPSIRVVHIMVSAARCSWSPIRWAAGIEP